MGSVLGCHEVSAALRAESGFCGSAQRAAAGHGITQHRSPQGCLPMTFTVRGCEGLRADPTWPHLLLRLQETPVPSVLSRFL